ncbi:MAG: nitrate- and nitrite sensing domain-containing protein, partial [Actinomadura sp.]
MRSRTRSIRFKISALLGVPVVALVVLWGFVAAVTGEDALEQRDFDLLNDRLGGPAQNLVRELGQERLRTAMFLSTGATGGAAERGDLNAQRARTDAAAAAFRTQVLAPEARTAYPEATRRYADEMIRRLDGLAAVRSTADPRPADRLAAITGYNAVLDSLFRFFGELSARGDVSLDHGAQAIITAHRGLDVLGRESALIAAAGTAGRLTEAEHEMFSAQVTTRRFLMEEARTRLAEAGFRDAYEPVFVSPAYVTLTSLEDRIVDNGARLPDGLSAWQPTARTLGNSFDGAAMRARTSLAERSDQISERSLLRLGVAGGLGLVMLVASILFSVRFGRRLTRELVGLQEAARDLAEVQLPEVVDKLRQRT